MENNLNFTVAAVLPAGGTGQRMGLPIPKQFHKVCGRPLICYTLDAFENIPWIGKVAVPVANDWKPYLLDLIKENNYTKIILADGKSTRHRSIYEGVLALNNKTKAPDVVIIHDAVRPLVDEKTLRDIASAARNHGASGAVRPLISTVVVKDDNGLMDHSLDRSQCRSSEMPQGFRYNVIAESYKKTSEDEFEHGTECLQLARTYMGIKAKLVDGPDTLWKVTHQKDIHTLERILQDQIKTKVFVHNPGNKRGELYQSIITGFQLEELKVVELQQNGFGTEEKIENFNMLEEKTVQKKQQSYARCFTLLFLDDVDQKYWPASQMKNTHKDNAITFLVYPRNTRIFHKANEYVRNCKDDNLSSNICCGISYEMSGNNEELASTSKKILDLMKIIRTNCPATFHTQIFEY